MTPTCDFLNARRAMHFTSSKWVSTLTLILWDSQGVPSEKIRLRIFIQLKNKVFPLRLFSILNRYWPVQRPSSTDGVMSLMNKEGTHKTAYASKYSASTHSASIRPSVGWSHTSQISKKSNISTKMEWNSRSPERIWCLNSVRLVSMVLEYHILM